MATNKILLNKAIKFFAFALPAMFIGPSVIHFAFINKQQPLYILILLLGIIICIAGMLLIVKGLKTILKSLYEDES